MKTTTRLTSAGGATWPALEDLLDAWRFAREDTVRAYPERRDESRRRPVGPGDGQQAHDRADR